MLSISPNSSMELEMMLETEKGRRRLNAALSSRVNLWGTGLSWWRVRMLLCCKTKGFLYFQPPHPLCRQDQPFGACMASVWSQSLGCAVARVVGIPSCPPGRDRGRSSGWSWSPRTCLSLAWGGGWRCQGCFLQGWIETGTIRGAAPRCKEASPLILVQGESW